MGNGTATTMNGVPATANGFEYPAFITFGKNGNMYFSIEPDFNLICTVDTFGVSSIIAGVNVYGTGYSGDGGPATNAKLNQPNCLTTDSAGNVFFSDGSNNRVRKIDISSGIITTIAGNGTAGIGSVGIPATAAELDGPVGLACDAVGNIYLSDNAPRILRIGPDGIINNFAGNGVRGFSGDGGPASAAEFMFITGLTLDNKGNLFITDKYRIRRIDLSSDTISTVAGNGDSTYNGEGIPATDAQIWPQGPVSLDSSGCVFWADVFNYRVREIDPCGNVRTVAGTGVPGFSGDGESAISAEFNWPESIGMDKLYNIYVADMANNRIRKITPVSDTCSHGGLAVKQPTAPAGAGLRLSPNPTYGMLKISAPWPVEALEVVDALGRTVLQRKFNAAYSQDADVGQLPPGVYCAIVNGGARKMFVKE